MRSWTVGRYLVERMRQVGLRHVFGVPGDYVLALLDEIVDSEVELVGTCNELNAGYAADAYARVNGVGAVCVTYAVGGFSVLNAIAGAYAEQVPVIAVAGGPNRSDRDERKLLHPTLGHHGIQVEVFRHVTQESVLLTDADDAPEQIDRAIAACVAHRRPVFIEVPADLVKQPCRAPRPREFDERPPSDPDATREAVEEAVRMLLAAERPVVLGGVELHRFGVQPGFVRLVERAGCPVATVLLGKSVIAETHPQYVGLYRGALSEDYVRETVEGADCVLSLGAWMTDINLGIYTADIDTARLIHSGAWRVQIRHHHFERVFLGDFIDGLFEALPAAPAPRETIRPASRALVEPFAPAPEERVSVARFFERMNHFLREGDVVLADAGDSFLCAGDLIVHHSVGFICQAFYCSLGFSLPGALGVGLADRSRRAVVFAGDGALQMTVQELSTLVRQRLNPIVFVMNNRGYTIERAIHDGPYNDIQNWRYHSLPEVFGGGWSCEVHKEAELEAALERAREEPDRLALIEVHIDPQDCSSALERLGQALGERQTLTTGFRRA
ncbi:MAG: alpha-keto acid decarboxylase family protein [Proteobacteria bacterium]|nr:alpha-keto acid decarboxylase family protein [Pseudomonadota bacterium]